MSTFTGTETPNVITPDVPDVWGEPRALVCVMDGGPQRGLLLLFGTSLETTTRMCYIAVPYFY